MNKKAISLNIFFSLLQIFITGVTYYFLYKFLLQKIGSDLMGVWAIVLSVSSTANIANLGIGSSVVRYTAKFKVNREIQNINNLVHTSLLFLSAVFFAICVIVYLIAPFWLHAVIKSNYYYDAISLIPFSLACLFFNAISGIFLSCIDGMQKNYIRSLIYIFSFTILMVLSYLLVPKYGLMGIAYAQSIQSVFLLIAGIVSLKLIFKPLQLYPITWDKDIFKKIFSFGIKEQIISICQLCFDPFTKSILGSFGSLGMVTYYEMANRLVTQLRGFLVSANQVFIPVFTNTNEKSADATNTLYKKIFSINFLVSIIWLTFIIASVIPISKIWLGALNNEFVFITIFLAFAYWCNIIISPAYFSNMGSATLTDNVIGNIIIAVSNIILCTSIGYFFKGLGVVFGWSMALSLGSLYIMYKYHGRNNIQIFTLLTQKDTIIIICSFLYCMACVGIFYVDSFLNTWLMFTIDFIMLLSIFSLVYFIHPISKNLLNSLKRKV